MEPIGCIARKKKRTCNYRINAHNAEWHTV